MLVWILTGVVGVATISLLAGLSVAAVLGHIGREVTDLFEFEAWATAPLGNDFPRLRTIACIADVGELPQR